MNPGQFGLQARTRRPRDFQGNSRIWHSTRFLIEVHRPPFLNIAKTFESLIRLSSFSSTLQTGTVSWQFVTLSVTVRELSRQYGERQVVIYVRGSYFTYMLCYFDYGVVRVLANRLRDKQQTLKMKSCSDGNRRDSTTVISCRWYERCQPLFKPLNSK